MMRLKYFVVIIALVSLFQACKEEEVFEDPYAGGKTPLGVSLSMTTPPSPVQAVAGATVSFSANGLLPYKDQISFYFNGQKAEIVNVTDSEIQVKIPLAGSSGVTSLTIGEQVFFGPSFKVSGKIELDPELQVTAGTNGAVRSYYNVVNDERIILVGQFSKYNNQGTITPYRGLVRIFKTGAIDQSFKSGGASGALYSMTRIGNKYFVAGSFSAFYHFGRLNQITEIDNITRLNEDGSLDSIRVSTSLTPVLNGKTKAVPAFNGGTNSAIRKIFPTNNKIVAIGGFRYYLRHRYDVPKKPIVSGNTTIYADSIVTDSIEAPQIVRFEQNGDIDKTYRFNNALGKGLEAGNGSINDGYMHSDGKLVLVGNFAKFDAKQVNRIVRLDANGIVDPTFNTGSGANSSIYSITFNEVTKKYLISGSFGSFNEVNVNGVVRLNEDGTIDNSFKSKQFGDGSPTFSKQLSNGLIVVSGSFITYDNVRRAGFMILNDTGELAPGYNTTGVLDGVVNDIYESTNSTGKMTVTLMGSFKKFDGKNIENVTRITLEP